MDGTTRAGISFPVLRARDQADDAATCGCVCVCEYACVSMCVDTDNEIVMESDFWA